MLQLTEKAKELRKEYNRNYQREYRKKNSEKLRMANIKSWNKKAEQLKEVDKNA